LCQFWDESTKVTHCVTLRPQAVMCAPTDVPGKPGTYGLPENVM